MRTVTRRPAHRPGPPHRAGPRPAPAGGLDTAVTEEIAELCAELLASLPRSDQRRRGAQYVRGLLATPGRKSIRNMAALLGGTGTEQSLHHFICHSTWDWTPVRRALAHRVTRAADPQAWVVRPLLIPKAGEHSVGVTRCTSPVDGQVRNAQRAVGVWTVTEQAGHPVNWRLHLPPAWLADGLRRRQAAIPEGLRPRSLSVHAVEACLELRAWGLAPRPVVLDTGEPDTVAALGLLRAAGLPFAARIGEQVSLTVADRALAGYDATPLPAGQIMRAARELRRPVTWLDGGAAAARRPCLVAAVRVRAACFPTAGAGRARPGGDLLLVGVGPAGPRWPAGLWLTDLPDAAAIVRYGGLTRRVDQDLAEITDRVGIRDYTGRTYGGWHRHVTLASAAHVIAAPPAAGMRTGRAS
ncbi:IS701 family transposase [Thermomonospora amylolytica]|uniref:IS701 family transposase n=1 Tax=Thermomonospora amylolytica TaxID=1411117 RepID=UPI0018E4FD94|nr:transposase [Thermomonospora amylolytica]